MRHAFTAEAIEQMRPNIEDISQVLLDRIDCTAGYKVDLIGEFASRLPAYVIMDLLDVPHHLLPRWGE